MARGRKKKQPDKIDEAMESLTPNLTKETFNEFVQKALPAQREIDDAAAELSAAKGVLNGIFKQAEKAGIDKKDFKWALAQGRMDHDERESSHRRRMDYMAFMDMPFGTQVSFDFAGAPGKGEEPENQPETMTELQRHRITSAGKSAGQGGMRADTNPWNPGTYAHTVWHDGWMETQSEAAAKLGDSAA